MIRTLVLPLLFAAAPAPAAEMPRINLEALDRTHPGWTATEQSGDPNAGVIAAERIVWPMFYLHWFPIEKTGGTLGAGEAEKLVSELWQGLPHDGPLKAEKVLLPAHEGFQIETTTSHGEMRNRYYVWACPDSGRVFVADTILNTTVNAPQILLDWQRDMTRTVRCHAKAAVDQFPHLNKHYDVPGGGVSYAMPFLWAPIEGYRIQTSFGEHEFGPPHVAVTLKEGQDLALASDAMLRLYLTWRPSPDDFPMSYEVLKKETEDFWLSRAKDIMVEEMRAQGGIWIMEGRARLGPSGAQVPPARAHKFRSWLWRDKGKLYLAVGTIAGVRFGRRFPSQTVATWDRVLQEMLQSITP